MATAHISQVRFGILFAVDPVQTGSILFPGRIHSGLRKLCRLQLLVRLPRAPHAHPFPTSRVTLEAGCCATLGLMHGRRRSSQRCSA